MTRTPGGEGLPWKWGGKPLGKGGGLREEVEPGGKEDVGLQSRKWGGRGGSGRRVDPGEAEGLREWGPGKGDEPSGEEEAPWGCKRGHGRGSEAWGKKIDPRGRKWDPREGTWTLE